MAEEGCSDDHFRGVEASDKNTNNKRKIMISKSDELMSVLLRKYVQKISSTLWMLEIWNARSRPRPLPWHGNADSATT